MKETVIPQIRTITRYGTWSVILFNCAERNSLVKQSEQSPTKNDFRMRFRTDRLTSIVPYAVRFALRNDNKRVIK